MNRAERIRALREQSSKSVQEMATLLGVTISSWLDLEQHDDEVATCISLRQVYLLSSAFAVSPRTLLSPDPSGNSIGSEISLKETASLAERHMRENHLTLEQFEDDVGWYLAGFFANPESALDEPAMFLQDLCAPIGVHWLGVVAKDVQPPNPVVQGTRDEDARP